jgi:hypothetical protein
MQSDFLGDVAFTVAVGNANWRLLRSARTH